MNPARPVKYSTGPPSSLVPAVTSVNPAIAASLPPRPTASIPRMNAPSESSVHLPLTSGVTRAPVVIPSHLIARPPAPSPFAANFAPQASPSYSLSSPATRETGAPVPSPNEQHEKSLPMPSESSLTSPTPTPNTAVESSTSSSSSSSASSSSTPSNQQSHSHHAAPITIFCFDISRWSPSLQLVCLSLGIFFFFLINGYVEEYLFRKFPNFNFGWYLTAWELYLFAFFALIERLMRGEKLLSHKIPLRDHFIVAISVTLARGLTNVSMQLLNYPTLVIFKSLKLLTVMIGSLFIVGRKFELREYVSAFLLVASATLFSLGDKEVKSDFNWIGIVVVLLSLVFDSVQANTQDRILTRQKCELTEAILFSNFFSAVLSMVWTIISGEWFEAYAYCHEHPLTYQLFILRAFVLYHGVVMLLAQIKLFGAVMANVVTTVRKVLTVLLSFFMFSHPLTSRHLFGLMLFAAALALNDLAKFMKCGCLSRLFGGNSSTQSSSSSSSTSSEKASLLSHSASSSSSSSAVSNKEADHDV